VKKALNGSFYSALSFSSNFENLEIETPLAY
jgi:hypothetical protein